MPEPVYAVLLQPSGEVALPAARAVRAEAFARQFNQLMEHTTWSAHVVPIVFKIESHLEQSARLTAPPPPGAT